MTSKIEYEFRAKIWRHASPGGWYFVSLPREMAREIRSNLKWQEEGWGRLRTTARIGNSTWQTAIWFDSKHDTYILPVKSEIRKLENLDNASEITVFLLV